MLSAVFTLLNLASFINLNGALKQTPIGPTVDLGYATYPGSQSYRNEVNLGYVTYLGNQPELYPETVAYLGIPYAERPVGDRRFRAPLPLDTERVAEEAGGEPVDATQYPDFCIQGSLDFEEPGGAGSEDCLKVNIYAPRSAQPGDNLPVLFYIHGGGWFSGNPRNFPFEHWIQQSPNVIIVSVYYRLASFGFLASPELPKEDLNAGLQDQIEALKWVQLHISKFGGDPTNVTISGHSAGGTSVELHMIIKESEELFSQAIAQSVGRLPLPTPEQQEPLFQSYASFAECGNGSMEEQMTCLRNATTSALAYAQDRAVLENMSYNLFRPVLDGVLVTGYPTSKFQRGEFARVPLIVGSASNETLTPPGFTIHDALRAFFPLLTESDAEEFLWLYREDDFECPSQWLQVATGEPNVICAAQAMSGPSSRYSPDNTWTYRYNTPDPMLGTARVTHAAEMWMMFDGINTGPNGTGSFSQQKPSQRAFASELIAYWLSFVRTGDPNQDRLERSPEWKKYNESNPVRMVLTQDPRRSTNKSGSFMEEQPAAETVRCAFAISKGEVCQH
ncbi:Alpha/Beta hydrolase protein [Suillus ampliporus]|nr:Alpha/Beta hydrolase protein [Suillus ampliporus]